MIDEVDLDHSTFKEVPEKFEAGTMNIAQEVGLGAAIDYLTELGMDAVREHEKQITAYAIERLLAPGRTVFGPTDVEHRGGAVSFWYKDIHPHDLAPVLDQRASHPRGAPLRPARDAAVRACRRPPARRSTCTTPGRGRRAVDGARVKAEAFSPGA